jgi:putative peptidoglycan lipid II flippase
VGAGTEPPSLGRATATVSAINAVSRVTGFGRVVATGAALGIATLGDTYQSATVISNVLFELLAGGLLAAVLVPTFVARMTDGDRESARRLAGVVLGRLLVVLAVVVVIGMAGARVLAEGLFVGAAPGRRAEQVDIAVVLLWFVLPQVLLYAVGAVVAAVLQAAHRFAAAAAAPIANNLIAIATMVLFAFVHEDARGLDLTTGEQVLLGGGTLLGTVAMTAVVVIASSRARLSVRPHWRDAGVGHLRPLVRKGLWGAGHVGLNQVHLIATIIIANSISGGAIAVTTALAFFLLPHALVAHPIATTLAPRLAAQAHRRDTTAFVADLGRGTRVLVLVLVPTAAMMVALARPGLAVLDGLGALDDDGLTLVSAAVAGLATAIVGYGAFFVLTRASYALDDVRGPTLVNLGLTASSIVAMLGVRSAVDGAGFLAGLGLVQGFAFTAGSLLLAVVVQRMTGHLPDVSRTLVTAIAAGGVGGAVAWVVSGAVGWDSRPAAIMATMLGGAAGVVVTVAVLRLLRAPDVEGLWSRGPGSLVRGRRGPEALP